MTVEEEKQKTSREEEDVEDGAEEDFAEREESPGSNSSAASKRKSFLPQKIGEQLGIEIAEGLCSSKGSEFTWFLQNQNKSKCLSALLKTLKTWQKKPSPRSWLLFRHSCSTEIWQRRREGSTWHFWSSKGGRELRYSHPNASKSNYCSLEVQLWAACGQDK